MQGFLQNGATFQDLSFHTVTTPYLAVSVTRASLRKGFPQTEIQLMW